MKVFRLLLINTILIFTSAQLIYSQAPASSKPVMNAVRLDKPFAINGKMDSPLWDSAPPVELKYEINPGDNAPATQKTIVRVMYDDKYLYFGFICYDTDPSQIRANITDRDNIFQDDFVIVGIDTYGDYQRAYELCVNPCGIIGDLLATNVNEDPNFDMIWHAAAARNDKGWTAEMAIPFSSLNFPDKDEQTWVLAIIRTVPRASRTQISWTQVDRNIPNLYPQAGILKGIKNIKSGGSIELLPYVMGQKSGYLSDPGDPNSSFKYDPTIGRFGAGIKYSPSPSFTLDAVVNPDFSQIESDAAQISVNTTFALYYDEKRPFFLAGRDLLPQQIYYSRSINDPLYAARITGKAGGLTYLYMGAYDRNTVFTIPGEDQSSTVGSNLKSMVNIGRLRYDFGDEIYIGGMFFSRNLDEGHNYVLGLDMQYKFWSNWYLFGNLFLSQTKEINNQDLFSSTRQLGTSGIDAGFNGENFSGVNLSVGVSHSDRLYNFSLTYNDCSPTFQTYDGLWTNVNYHQIVMQQAITFYPENSFFTRIQPFLAGDEKFNYSGLKKEQYLTPGLQIQTKGQTNINIGYLLVNDENFFGKELTGVQRTQININSAPIKEFSIQLSAQIGKFILRSADPVIGTGHNLTLQFGYKPTSQIDLSLSYSRARLGGVDNNDIYFDGNIYRFVGIYQFTPELLFRTIIQYDTFGGVFQLYPLISYKLNAFTTFYAGATGSYYNYPEGFGIKNTDQQYFVKLQYLLGI